jgi:hypothetical protein
MLKSKINNIYEKHDCQRICQGDILRDVSIKIVEDIDNKVIELFFPYIVIVSQDCDLENSKYKVPSETEQFNNQFLPSIIFLPAFPEETVREGKHLEKLFNVVQAKINSDLWKPIKKNHNERYHYLSRFSNLQVPDLIIDFKTYFTAPTKYFSQFYENHYLATVNELFREELSQRFSYYLSRIATPAFKNNQE